MSQKQERLRTASKSFSESAMNEVCSCNYSFSFSKDWIDYFGDCLFQGNISESSLSASQSSLPANRTTRSSAAAAAATAASTAPAVSTVEKDKPAADTPVAATAANHPKPPEKRKVTQYLRVILSFLLHISDFCNLTILTEV